MELEFLELLLLPDLRKIALFSYKVAQLKYRKKRDVRQKFEFLLIKKVILGGLLLNNLGVFLKLITP